MWVPGKVVRRGRVVVIIAAHIPAVTSAVLTSLTAIPGTFATGVTGVLAAFGADAVEPPPSTA